jgi:hypothetical protein
LIGLSCAVAWAQPGVPDDKDDAPPPFLDVLNHELDLTPNQRKAVKDILDKSKPEREAIEKQVRELSEKARKQQRADSEKIRAVLNDDQKERFDEFNSRLRRRQHGPAHRLRRDHGPLPDGGMPPPEMWHHGKKSAKPDELPDGPPEMIGAPKKDKE